MDNRIKKYLSVGILLLSFSARSQGHPELKIVADPWCPFTCDSKSEPQGVFVEVFREIFSSEFAVKYEGMSWSRAVVDSRQGHFNAILGALKADAPDFIFPENPVAYQKSCFYVLKQKKGNFKKLDSLNAVQLGAVKSYSYGEPLDDYIRSQEGNSKKLNLLTGTDTTDRLIKMLKDHRVDVMVEDEAVVSYMLLSKKNEKGELKQAGCLKASPLYIAFSPMDKMKSQSYADRFDHYMKDPRNLKKIETLYSKYGLKPVKK